MKSQRPAKSVEAASRQEPRATAPRARRREPTLVDDVNSQVEVKTIVKPVQKAMAILRYLAEVGEPCTSTQIARMLRINASTCFNILRTLAGEGVVSFDPTGKTYKLGPGILQIASNILSEESRLAAARPFLQAFADAHHATVCIWRRVSFDRNMLVAAVHARGTVRIHLTIGQGLPVLLGSTGRVMAPRLGLSKSQVRKEFKKLRWFNPPTFDDYWRDAEEAQVRGWAMDGGNFSAGVLTISTSIDDPNGDSPYLITALTFRDQHRGASIQGVGDNLVDLAGRLRSILY